MTYLLHIAAGLSMLMTFAVPSKRKLSPEIECTLTDDLAHLAKYNQLWRLKPSTFRA